MCIRDRHRGCDEKAVRKALQEDRIRRIGTDRRCIDAEVADIQWARNTRARGDSGKGPKPPAAPATSRGDKPGGDKPGGEGDGDGAEDDYRSMRARRERADAMMAEIELAKVSGKVLDREPAMRAIYTKFRELRDSCMVIGRRLAPQLAAMTDAREIRIVLERAQADAFEIFVTRSLQSLADQLHGVPTRLPDDVRQSPALLPEDQDPAR